jgi:hypothetical protein
MLLLIADEVFGTGHDPSALDSFDCLSKHHARQDRVRADGRVSPIPASLCGGTISPEPFPNPASCGLSSQRARDRPQRHVHPLVPILPANRLPPSKCKPSIESRGNIDASGEGRDVVGCNALASSSPKEIFMAFLPHLRPRGLSCRHKLGKPSRGISPVFPIHASPRHLSPTLVGSFRVLCLCSHTPLLSSSSPFPTRSAVSQSSALLRKTPSNRRCRTPMVTDNTVTMRLSPGEMQRLGSGIRDPGMSHLGTV